MRLQKRDWEQRAAETAAAARTRPGKGKRKAAGYAGGPGKGHKKGSPPPWRHWDLAGPKIEAATQSGHGKGHTKGPCDGAARGKGQAKGGPQAYVRQQMRRRWCRHLQRICGTKQIWEVLAFTGQFDLQFFERMLATEERPEEPEKTFSCGRLVLSWVAGLPLFRF